MALRFHAGPSVLSGDLIKKGLRPGIRGVSFTSSSKVLSGDLIKKGLRPFTESLPPESTDQVLSGDLIKKGLRRQFPSFLKPLSRFRSKWRPD